MLRLNLAVLIIVSVLLLGLGGLTYLVYWSLEQIKAHVVGHTLCTTKDISLQLLEERKLLEAQGERLAASLRDKTELLIKTQGELTDSLRETIVEVGKVVVSHSDTVKAHSQALLDSAHTNEVSPRRVVSRG